MGSNAAFVALANSGVMTGDMSYDYTNKRILLNFTQKSYAEVYIFNSNGGATNQTGQYVYRISSACGSGTCESNPILYEMPAMTPSSSAYVQTNQTQVMAGGVTCTKYTAVSSSYSVSIIWFSTAGQVCEFTWTDGRVFNIISSTLVATTPAASLFTVPTGCSCGLYLNLALVLDGSASITTADWGYLNDFVRDFANRFQYGATAVALTLVTFGDTATTELSFSTNPATVQAKLSGDLLQPQNAQSCTSCGIFAAATALKNRAQQAPNSIPVLVTITDGDPNVAKTPAFLAQCGGTNVTCELQKQMDSLKSSLPNLQTFAVGVGSVSSVTMTVLAGGKSALSGHQFTFPTYLSLKTNGGIPVGYGSCYYEQYQSRCGTCCGFCTCNQCVLPDTCDDFDQCTNQSVATSGCCNAPVSNCLDQDACHSATCDSITGTCTQTPVVCSLIQCYNATCDPVVGCQYNYKCPNPDLCTYSYCSDSTPEGECIYTPNFCGADNFCTNYSCDLNTGYCIATDLSARCDDGNPCTDEICDVSSSSCIVDLKTCEQFSACFPNPLCNNQTGTCQADPLNCDDNNKCTTDSCNYYSGCENDPIDCRLVPLPDPCLNYSGVCSPSAGCVFIPKSCDDNNVTTIDKCNSTDGSCYYIDICATSNCSSISNQCFEFQCSPTGTVGNCDLVFTKFCNDGDACTGKDRCDNATGCVFPPITCPFIDNCTVVFCNSQDTTGNPCRNKSVTCQDENPCTDDTCDLSTGNCKFTAHCPDSDLCFDRWCEFGDCMQVSKCAVSKDPCYVTTGTCNLTTGCETISKCVSDVCTTNFSCINGQCSYTPLSCDDNNRCTLDSCDKNASAGQQCIHTPISCDDNNVCTVDTCDPQLGCVNTVPPNKCNDYNACTKDSCNPLTGCSNINISSQCDDGDNCTIDSCDVNFGCVRYEKICDNTECEIGYCRLGQCLTTRSGCIPRGVIIATVGGGVGILVAILIAVLVVMCCAAHGTAYYHGLHTFYFYGPVPVKKEGDDGYGKNEQPMEKKDDYTKKEPVAAYGAGAAAGAGAGDNQKVDSDDEPDESSGTSKSSKESTASSKGSSKSKSSKDSSKSSSKSSTKESTTNESKEKSDDDEEDES